jgi:hypothetical protein
MTCADAQVRLMMRERSKGRSQEQAAVKANLKTLILYKNPWFLFFRAKMPGFYWLKVT